ncbi:hypothetical protein [Caenispirillum bisanense]|uniref:hypothetical protein n=1 Tax=Caenispirillum bisanense TaxID=414052 RepID=UPI0031D655D8
MKNLLLTAADIERLATKVSSEVMRYEPRNMTEARAGAGAFAGEFLPELDEVTRSRVIARAVGAMRPLIELHPV